MSKRHKRHIHLLNKLYNLGWDVEFARPAYCQLPNRVFMGVRTIDNFCGPKSFVLTGISIGVSKHYKTPPLPNFQKIAFFISNRNWCSDARILNGWSELSRFAVEEAERQGKTNKKGNNHA